MITIDLSQPLPGLDDQPLGNQTLGKLVATALANLVDGPAIKIIDWARSLHQTGIVELDAADLDLFKQKVESSQHLSILIKGPVLKIVAAAKK